MMLQKWGESGWEPESGKNLPDSLEMSIVRTKPEGSSGMLVHPTMALAQASSRPIKHFMSLVQLISDVPCTSSDTAPKKQAHAPEERPLA